eukprot:TRINITY_DN704_c0_g1_i7.p1 TRINITY_DN704_c0_g1~~TRINITY_DN704_c0_g1_i7.p1  ORF type:complete len:107 (+),score=3.33 TRINITY_DN704_c0_g1_i7:103-423(+)
MCIRDRIIYLFKAKQAFYIYKYHLFHQPKGIIIVEIMSMRLVSVCTQKQATQSLEVPYLKAIRLNFLCIYIYSQHLLIQCQLPCTCLLYTSPSPRDRQKSRMPSSA